MGWLLAGGTKEKCRYKGRNEKVEREKEENYIKNRVKCIKITFFCLLNLKLLFRCLRKERWVRIL